MMQHHIRSLLSQKQAGHIINIASVAGMKPFPLSSGYGASKAALMALTQSAAKEYASRGINVNSISPGALERPNVKGWSKSVSHCFRLPSA
jgi:NAD(P)-dependent dehydrogenase (short-subunit alcohol dehydrogenase family)